MNLWDKKLLERLDQMLEDGLNGTFQETDYDESQISRLEAKWMRYLTSSKLAQQSLEQERKNDSIETAIGGYVNQDESHLTYMSKQSLIDEFQDYMQMFWIVGGALCLILAMIGILNFVEVIVTEVFARQHV